MVLSLEVHQSSVNITTESPIAVTVNGVTFDFIPSQTSQSRSTSVTVDSSQIHKFRDVENIGFDEQARRLNLYTIGGLLQNNHPSYGDIPDRHILLAAAFRITMALLCAFNEGKLLEYSKKRSLPELGYADLSIKQLVWLIDVFLKEGYATVVMDGGGYRRSLYQPTAKILTLARNIQPVNSSTDGIKHDQPRIQR